jgi:hypothetical protein
MSLHPARILLAACVCASSALAGCGGTPGAPARATAMMASDFEAAGLATRLKRLYGGIFDLYDANDDGEWGPKDFELPEDRFLNLFHKEDADDDRIVTKAEFYTKAEHDDMLLYCEARATVTSQTVGGRVSFDKAFDVLDVYLAPYLNKDDRKKFIKKAFATADADDTDYLKVPELEAAYGILLAKAEEKRIEKAVNRSKGQPDKPIGIDPPSWVKNKPKA